MNRFAPKFKRPAASSSSSTSSAASASQPATQPASAEENANGPSQLASQLFTQDAAAGPSLPQATPSSPASHSRQPETSSSSSSTSSSQGTRSSSGRRREFGNDDDIDDEEEHGRARGAVSSSLPAGPSQAMHTQDDPGNESSSTSPSSSSSSSSTSTSSSTSSSSSASASATSIDDAHIDSLESEHPSGIVPTVQNIVGTCNLCCKLDLKEIAMKARNAEYNPKRFSAVIMRIRDPKTTALIFSSGKMVCTGAKSEADCRLACRKYARIVQKLGFPETRFSEFTIQNMVASCDVRFPIRLEGLSSFHEEYSSYEPELFPGLIYRMVEPKIVLLIFVSGKVVLTGAKTREQIFQAFETIYPTLVDFRKDAKPTARNSAGGTAPAGAAAAAAGAAGTGGDDPDADDDEGGGGAFGAAGLSLAAMAAHGGYDMGDDYGMGGDDY